jgi:hypothetical protein
VAWWPWGRTEEERERDELLARVTVLVRKDRERHIRGKRAEGEGRPTRARGGSVPPYAYVTSSLREFEAGTLKVIEDAAPSLAQPAGPGIYRFLLKQLRSPIGARTSPRATPEANVLDGLVLHDLAPELVEKWRVRRRVRLAFELGESSSLHEDALGRYGRAILTTVLRTTAALDAVLTSRAARDMPTGLGYEGIDAWSDLMDGVVPMTPGLVRLIHEAPPSPEELVEMSRDGRLGELGIRPADLDDRLHQRLLAELRERCPEV